MHRNNIAPTVCNQSGAFSSDAGQRKKKVGLVSRECCEKRKLVITKACCMSWPYPVYPFFIVVSMIWKQPGINLFGFRICADGHA